MSLTSGPCTRTGPIPETEITLKRTGVPASRKPVSLTRCLPMLLASGSERVRNVIRSGGTRFLRRVRIACSARSKFEKTPTAVFIDLPWKNVGPLAGDARDDKRIYGFRKNNGRTGRSNNVLWIAAATVAGLQGLPGRQNFPSPSDQVGVYAAKGHHYQRIFVKTYQARSQRRG